MKIEDIIADVQRLSNDSSLAKLPVSKDILRLARKVKIKKKNPESLDAEKQLLVVAASHPDKQWVVSEDVFTEVDPFKSDENVDDACAQADVLFHLLTNLSQCFQPVEGLTRENFNQSVNMNDHYSVTKFLIEHFGEDGAVINLLKSCHQTIIARILHRLRDTLRSGNTGLEFKDVRGSWRIFIHYDDDHVCTIHRRREQIYSKNTTEFAFDTLFEFEWELQCNYNKENYKVESVQMHLISIDPNGDSTRTDLDQQGQILKQCFINCGANVDHCFDPATYVPETASTVPKSNTANNQQQEQQHTSPRRRFCQIL
jgi:hypothetical protein